jgi:hypothetical protein
MAIARMRSFTESVKLRGGSALSNAVGAFFRAWRASKASSDPEPLTAEK